MNTSGTSILEKKWKSWSVQGILESCKPSMIWSDLERHHYILYVKDLCECKWAFVQGGYVQRRREGYVNLRDLCKCNWKATKARRALKETRQFNTVRLYEPTRYVREEGFGSTRVKCYCKGEIATQDKYKIVVSAQKGCLSTKGLHVNLKGVGA